MGARRAPTRRGRTPSPTRTSRQAYSSAASYAPTDIGRGMGANKTDSSIGVLEAEFFAAMVLIALTIFTDTKASSDYASVMLAAMKRGTMIIVLFFLLAILSAAGPNAGRAAKAFGALVIVGLILAQAENGLFSMLDNFFKADWSSGGTSGTSDNPGSGPSSANAPTGQQKNVNTTGIGATGSNGSLGSDIQNVNVGGLTIQNIESGIGSIVSQLPAAVQHATDPVSDIPGLGAAIKKVLGWL